MNRFGFGIAVWLLSYSCSVSADVRTVTLRGDPAPGTGGASFFSLFSPAINNAGQTAFSVTLTGTGVDGSNDVGKWSEGGGMGLALVARAGNVAPGTDANFQSTTLHTSLFLNTVGQTAFDHSLVGANVNSTNNRGIWSESSGVVALVARTGDVAPGTDDGASFDSFNINAFNDAGQAAIFGTLTGPGMDPLSSTGIWSEGGGNGLQLIARRGAVAAGTASDVFYGHLGPVVLNNTGQALFAADLFGPGVTTFERGIWRGATAGDLSLVARTGDPAPGTGSDTYFKDLAQAPVINGAGHTAFFASLQGSGAISGVNHTGIWSDRGGNGLQLVARADDPAPISGSDLKVAGFRGQVVINGAGETAFIASLRGTDVNAGNNTAIFSEGGGGGVKLVAREGDTAPGTSAQFDALENPILNRRGQAAFLSSLKGIGVDGTNNMGIWAEDQEGTLQLIVRTGDLFDVDDGPGEDLRTIQSLTFWGFTGNQDGRPSQFNDRGQLAFRAAFADFSNGIFVSNLVAVPEPSVLVLALFASACAVAIRRPATRRELPNRYRCARS